MISAKFYREQANLLLSWAASATDGVVKEQLRNRAQEYLRAADSLEQASPLLPTPSHERPVIQQQQQPQPSKEDDKDSPPR
jgi:hypothetical protein